MSDPIPDCCEAYLPIVEEKLAKAEAALKDSELRGFTRAIEMLREGTEHELGSSCYAGDCELCMRRDAAAWLEARKI